MPAGPTWTRTDTCGRWPISRSPRIPACSTSRAELRLMDPAVVRLELAGISPDGARFRLRNTIVRADGRTAATVTSTIGWLDLGERRLTTPPAELHRLVADLPRTEDFAELPSLRPR